MTSRSPRFVLWTLACFSVGCGPVVRPTLHSLQAFSVSTPCGQGPYEIELEATGARWGESVSIVAYSRAPLAMRYEIRVGDEEATEGSLAGFFEAESLTDERGQEVFQLRTSEAVFDNTLCSLAHVEAALNAGAQNVVPGERVNIVTPPLAAPSDGTQPVEVSGESTLKLVSVSWTDLMSTESMYQQGLGMTGWGTQEWANRDPDQGAPLVEGTTIRVRLWSEVPNPLEGVTFVVRQQVFTSSIPEEEYAAHLRERRAENERELQERQARGPSRRQRRLAERRRRRAERLAERQRFCSAHRDDTDCWGEGGYEGNRRRAEAQQREAQALRLEAEAQAAAAMPSPDGPPPPPRADPPPPKASTNARWVAGYWHWVRQWVWISGRWDVPEADIVAQQTVHAPSAPPPPRAESVPASPAPGLVWAAGYWQWDGAQFVWIAGRWDVAQSGAQWQAPRWQVQAGGAIFVPGRWLIQVR